ncbi:hypothetical protein L2E82_16122 [Cichorium intybus]|uniref:Uncharacterized protein n=1 Tax=Cichorium intybus TaxID=13427 RepID=A0ACB9F408_CICIN|nr:hypothetical protein L2E82_16122 [Cichorium intybus]
MFVTFVLDYSFFFGGKSLRLSRSLEENNEVKDEFQGTSRYKLGRDGKTYEHKVDKVYSFGSGSKVSTSGKGYCGALGHGDEIDKTTLELLASLKNHFAVQV